MTTWNEVVIWHPEIKDSAACHMAVRGEVVLTVSEKCKNNKGTWQREWNAKMLANFLQALQRIGGCRTLGGGAGHMFVLWVLETGGVTRSSL